MEATTRVEEVLHKGNNVLKVVILSLSEGYREAAISDLSINSLETFLDQIRSNNLDQNGQGPPHKPWGSWLSSEGGRNLNSTAVLLSQSLIAKYGREAIVGQLRHQLELPLPLKPEPDWQVLPGDLRKEAVDGVSVKAIFLVAADKLWCPGRHEVR